MSKEAMKLALRSLKELVPDDSDYAPALQGQRKRQENAIKTLQKALAEQPAQPQQDIKFNEGLHQEREARLTQPQQEPVAVVSGYYGGQCVILPIDPARIFNSNTALYTSPPAQQRHISYVCPQCYWSLDEQPAQPQQEPVALLNAIRAEPTEMIHKYRVIDIIQSSPPQGIYYTPPAQRTWVGLTLEDMETTHWSPDFRAGAKWAAAKLKEKNT